MTPTDLIERSQALGADRSVCNEYGGNTSAKTVEPDHVGRETRVLWVKGSGSDLAGIGAEAFTALRLDELEPLLEREEMSDEQMVAYLARCQLLPEMPRASIETLLHAFVPAAHVDHTHADAINWIACCENGEELAAECFGESVIWIPYQRPGFSLARLVGLRLREQPEARLVILAKHGLVTWGESSDECAAATAEAIARAQEFVAERTAGVPAFGGSVITPLGERARRELLAEALPVLRGLASAELPRVLQVDASEPVLQFVCGRDAATLTAVGAACPDHLVHTRRLPLWIEFDPEREGPEQLLPRLAEKFAAYRRELGEYVERFGGDPAAPTADTTPRVVLVQGVGMITLGRNLKQARLSAALYRRAIEVMRGAQALGGFISLDEAESFAIEFWPLELYKLTLAPPPRELEGRVAFVTGGAGGIGSAVCRELASAGASIVVADIDADGAAGVAAELGDGGHGLVADVTSEDSVASAFAEAVLLLGGVDIVVSNAGAAASAPIEETSVDDWDRQQALLGRGYFLVARAAFRVMRDQGIGGSVVFVASKNGIVAGRNASAYSAAKALELHLARCLAEEGGEAGIRVNSINPDAVLDGSRIWSSAWREERAAAYGIAPEELEQHYRDRTGLKVSVLADDVARAVRFFASPAWSAKTTGNMLNVDGGVSAAFPR
ncbi:MAG TPA: bifunctional rhamnulose-1-phosphate aldolase/short-chain dehydrogenase [Solirubrobacterales bacterium]|nr:bifunctional rhamnulose-1-phosphate aldolase/short-chain dehydrogenase [Solirubrobacterales bacterium]